MADGDVRVCFVCHAVSIEDDQEFVDYRRCPQCGSLFDEVVNDPGPQTFRFVIKQDLPS